MPIQTAFSVITNIPVSLLLGPLLLIHFAFLVKVWPEKPRHGRGWSVEEARDLYLGLNGLPRPKKEPKATTEAAVQVKDSICERTIEDLSESLAKATESLSLKDLKITTLTESRRELQILYSEMQGRAERGEERIAQLTARLANLEEECASKDAQTAQMKKRSEEQESNAASMKELIASQEKSLLLSEETSRNQVNHNQTLAEILKSQQKVLIENDAVINQFSAKIAAQASQIDSMTERISSLTEECESLEETCESLTSAATQNEETIAQLRINLAKETAATGDWKDLYVQSLSQPSQPRVRMQTETPLSALSIQGIIAEKDRRIAELNDRFTECYGQLLASQAGNLLGRSSVVGPSPAETSTSKAAFSSYTGRNSFVPKPFSSVPNSLDPSPYAPAYPMPGPNPFTPNLFSAYESSAPNPSAPDRGFSGTTNPIYPAASAPTFPIPSIPNYTAASTAPKVGAASSTAR